MKKILFASVLFLNLVSVCAYAQIGDTHINAVPILHQGTWVDEFNNSGMTLQSPISNCQNFTLNNSNKWFAFTATSEYVKVNINGDNPGNNSRVVLWKFSGSTLIELGCSIGTTNLVLNYSSLEVGGGYFLSVETRYSNIPYIVNITNGDLPGNRTLSAIQIPHNQYWENNLTNANMAIESPISNCQNFTFNASNKWYKFKASSNYIKIEVKGDNGGNNTRIVLWEKLVGSWTELGCNIGTTSLSIEYNSLSVNSEYFLSVESRYNNVPYKLIIKGGVFKGYWTMSNSTVHPTELSNKLGIGIDIVPNDFSLAINGKAIMEEIKVENVDGADFVFAPNYDLMPLSQIESYIKQNRHLPEVPSAAAMEANGIELGKMNMLLLQKIEELTLLMIEQQKEIQKQNERIVKLEEK